MFLCGSANCRALRHNFCSATEATKATGATMQEGGLVLWRYFFSELSGLSPSHPSHPFRLSRPSHPSFPSRPSRPSYLFVAFRFPLSVLTHLRWLDFALARHHASVCTRLNRKVLLSPFSFLLSFGHCFCTSSDKTVWLCRFAYFLYRSI